MSKIPSTEFHPRKQSEFASDLVCGSRAQMVACAAVLLASLRLFADGEPNTNEIPALIPPRPELLPSFWEQNERWVLLVATAAMLAFGMIIWVLTRAKPPVCVPPGAQARNSLHALDSKNEDQFVLSEVGRILKGYFIAAFDLTPGELTTTEFRHKIQQVPTINREFSMKIALFLERCDERKFALESQPQPPMKAVAQATELVNAAELLRAASQNEARLPVATQPSTHPNS